MSNTDATPVTAEEELERIALTDTDAGVLARILLGQFHDVPDVMDSVPADSAPPPPETVTPQLATTQTTPMPVSGTAPVPFPPEGTTAPVTIGGTSEEGSPV